MLFYFTCPVQWCGRQAAEIEMEADLSGSPSDPNIEALYAYALEPGQPRYEIKRGTPEFQIAAFHLLSNPQERVRIEDEWPEDEMPLRRAVVNEHSTYFGRI
jgi:hypothetical protein